MEDSGLQKSLMMCSLILAENDYTQILKFWQISNHSIAQKFDACDMSLLDVIASHDMG